MNQDLSDSELWTQDCGPLLLAAPTSDFRLQATGFPGYSKQLQGLGPRQLCILGWGYHLSSFQDWETLRSVRLLLLNWFYPCQFVSICG
jgi:hypothetical protein